MGNLDYNDTMADAYPMFKRCWDGQPNSIMSSQDPDTWALLVAEHMVSRESQTWRENHEFTEAGGVYPGFYSLNDSMAPPPPPTGGSESGGGP